MANEARHTPGPWQTRTHGNGFIDIVADVQVVDGIATWQGIATMNESDDVARADAALIVAAPELLEASNALYFLAESLMKHLEIDPEATDFDFKLRGERVVKVSAAQFMAKARAAIDKALGSPQ